MTVLETESKKLGLRHNSQYTNALSASVLDQSQVDNQRNVKLKSELTEKDLMVYENYQLKNNSSLPDIQKSSNVS